MQSGFGVAFIYHHFYLKPTTCPKRTADASGCRHRNDRVSVFSSAGVSGTELLLELALSSLCALVQPLIDCAVCYKTLREEIEPQPKPYVHCIHKTALTQVRTPPLSVDRFATCCF